MKMLPLAVGISCALAAQTAFANDDRIEKLEQQVQNLNASIAAQTKQSNVSVNGFGSVAWATTNNDSAYSGVEKSGSFESDSLIGIQGSFKPVDGFEATLQMVARGEENWDPDVTWAFLSYTFDNQVQVRGGLLRLPLFMLSEYLEVGYAQPWARSPEEVYGRVPISSFTGGDISYEYELEDSYLGVQLFTGSEDLTGASELGGSGSVEDLYGAVVTWNDDYWTLRGSYTIATVTDVSFPSIIIPDGNGGFLDASLSNIEKADGSFGGIGVRYEDGNWLLMGEATRTKVDGYYSDTQAGYATAGYRINSVMPYVSLARLETMDDDDRKGLGTNPYQQMAYDGLSYQRTAYSLGARWDVKPGIALKGDVTYATNFDDSNGGLTGNNAREYEDAFVYTIKVDAAF